MPGNGRVMARQDVRQKRAMSGWWFQTGERWVLLLAVLAVTAGWLVVAIVDVLGMGSVLGVTKQAMVWTMLFGPAGPIEWLQWMYMVAFLVLAGYLVGRLAESQALKSQSSVRQFCLLMSVGMGFMLLEDAGDIRHMLHSYVSLWRGTEDALFGLPQGFVIDAPYLSLLAFIPLYALIRHGRSLWAIRSTRPYLMVGFGVYGLLGLGHVLSRLGQDGEERTGLYVHIGRLLDNAVFRGALERGGLPESRFYWRLTDHIVEETFELLAVAAMVGVLIVVWREIARAGLDAKPANDEQLVDPMPQSVVNEK